MTDPQRSEEERPVAICTLCGERPVRRRGSAVCIDCWEAMPAESYEPSVQEHPATHVCAACDGDSADLAAAEAGREQLRAALRRAAEALSMLEEAFQTLRTSPVIHEHNLILVRDQQAFAAEACAEAEAALSSIEVVGRG